MADGDAGRRGLAAIDAAIAAKPERDGRLLAEAMACLCAYRDTIAPPDRARATGQEKERLSRLNSIISMVMALQFPVGPAPWEEFERARDWLAGLLDDMPPTAVRR